MKIAVLLSGGVDSSVALNLLKEQNHDVTAFYLKIWLQDEFSFLGDCPWEEDLRFARAVCDKTGVNLEVLPLQTEYWNSVVTYTIEEIKEGRTPNPDMFCNSLIKFGQFYDRIDLSYEKVASGHYAKVVHDGSKYILKTTPDPVKDQTYFLAYLTQQQLSRAYFPLGDFNKQQVRDLAHRFKLANMDRKDSQGICFLGQIKFDEFIKHHLGELSGDIIEIETQKKLGKHKGYYFYTIGQRSGLGLSGGPWYVVKKDIKNNIIFISRQNTQELSKEIFSVGKFNWIAGEHPSKENLKVKIRHGAQYYNCNLKFIDEDSALVELDKGDRGIAPGQFAVFYDGDICLGGGVILLE
ncbi:MAG TPA: tRNA 2-thiouridine(34) synthase MnmA [Ignavibacteriaceae bacterium]|nr:tRNA 2-thiouridine(34) synthase MnmA [Ignavibacteriaceae bacterium]